jgi:hyperosmotically inducible periplasmic protein
MSRRWLVSIVLAAALGGCATVDRTEDLRIESEVKARLVAEKDANLTRLGVLSSNATVYLSGAVPASQQRAQAETLARSVRGVRRVVNTVEIAPPPR